MGETNAEIKPSRLTSVLSYISGAVLFFMMLLTVADVFMRYVFNNPLMGVQEITEFMLVTFIFFSLAYTETEGAHIRVEFIMDRLPLKFQVVTGRIFLVIEAMLLLCMSVMGVIKAIRVKDMNHVSGILSIPVYPFYLVVSLGSLAMALELFRDFHRKYKDNNQSI